MGHIRSVPHGRKKIVIESLQLCSVNAALDTDTTAHRKCIIPINSLTKLSMNEHVYLQDTVYSILSFVFVYCFIHGI